MVAFDFVRGWTWSPRIVKAFALAFFALLPGVSAAVGFKSTCTDAALTVGRIEPIIMRTTIKDPVLSMTQFDIAVVVGRAAATRFLERSAIAQQGQVDPYSPTPLSQAAQTILATMTDIGDAEAPVAVEGLYPPTDGVSSDTQRANILVFAQYRELFLDALLQGVALVRMDGQPVRRATATWYTASDEIGEVRGIWIGAGSVPFFDFCLTDPR